MGVTHQIAKFRERRQFSEDLPTGSAPYTTSTNFKLHDTLVKPKAQRWDHHLSVSSSRLQESPLKRASRDKAASMISLGTARPSPEFFPWEKLDFTCFNNFIPGIGGTSSSSTMSCSKSEIEYDLDIAMNYGYSGGSPQTLRFFTENVQMIHNPIYDDWECSVTCGTTSALDIALRIFCNAGDTVLIESFSYPGTLAVIKAQGLCFLSVEMDSLGLMPDDLNHKLESWDPERGRKPSVLYTIPTGQNPTGTTQTARRRKDIYEIAIKHDLIIIEDDPYYFMQLGSKLSSPAKRVPTLDEYVEQLPPSYLSLDGSGRVLRIDSASKILAPGLRLGWVTACSQIIKKFIAFTEVGTLSPSGPSQVMVYKLLDQTWGHEGFISWLISLSQQYSRRRDIMVNACQRLLPLDVCSWEIPTAGMFLWIRIDVTKHPEFCLARDKQEAKVRDICLRIEDRIYQKAMENLVLVSKGSWFIAQKEQLHEVSFRITFAAAPEDQLEKAIHGLGNAVDSEFVRN